MPAKKGSAQDDRLYVVPDTEPWKSNLDTRGREIIVFGPGGAFVVRSDELMTYGRPATQKDLREILGVSGLLRSGWGGAHLRYPVPFEKLLHALAFFREAWRRYRTEEILFLFLYYDEGRYELFHPPIRSASPVHVDCDIPDAPEGAVRFGDIHSHPRGAFHSPEDRDTDVKSPGLHIVVGDVDTPLPTLECVCSDGRYCFPVCPWDVFLSPPLPECPTEWFDDTAPRKSAPSPHTCQSVSVSPRKPAWLPPFFSEE